jgi:hypothetical protein
MIKPNEKKLLLRVPGAIFKALKDRADKNKRSVNSQIVYEIDKK